MDKIILELDTVTLAISYEVVFNDEITITDVNIVEGTGVDMLGIDTEGHDTLLECLANKVSSQLLASFSEMEQED